MPSPYNLPARDKAAIRAMTTADMQAYLKVCRHSLDGQPVPARGQPPSIPRIQAAALVSVCVFELARRNVEGHTPS